ncbi:conserved hypothetical protein [Psychromonas ingrahamii 37]|uniref:DUF2760 domain-containing protein n=1 Tax=Psychromonas ingrahamii (strain DSM 17664 / CCUG 51855 / 37) TaxID=357804 RepID=A1SU96_PSYIN|nr:DUF2760 domain-containing protein [Psychromonas ingrahamii]ABM03061.1 conserved hypothetical protein [Psychromonas ingrahamii 37]
MNIDLSAFPTTIDTLHLGLGISAVLFLVLFLTKNKSSTDQEILENNIEASVADIEQPVEKTIPEVTKAAALKESTPEAALQLLTLLQQEARFIDFTQEDLSTYSDADIGAVARVVHEGSKKILNDYFTLEAIRSEEEETSISISEGFNASEVRLTGNVVGHAPFNGTLIHKGWKVSEVKLPKLAAGHDASIIAPAEVEL